MKVTLSLAHDYTNLDLSGKTTAEIVDRIGSQLGAVEEVIDLGKRYQGVLIARVLSCRDHPDADRLHVCMIDDGGAADGVERDEQGYVQVVCGAPNVREGLLVAWLPPGSTVPSTHDKEPFVLEARSLRGVMSNGMLASSKELGISDDHDGILEIEEDVAPGTPFAEAYQLDDVIIDIENKMFTHRPDCFGVLGVYRELAGIYGQQFKGPEWYSNADTQALATDGTALPLEVHNELPELATRFTAITLSGVKVQPSPVRLQVHLMRAGIRPINNVVDVTNFLMYLTGQPLHAYDYNKLKNLSGKASLNVRYPREGEKIKLLNGKEIEPRAEAIMIASGDHLVGVGGVMGGSETEVDDTTTDIVLECATFDMYSVRRTSMAHGLFTDAVTRFNKGQSPLQNERIITYAVQELRKLTGAHVAGELTDDNHISPEVLARDSLHAPVTVSADFINTRLGLSLGLGDIATLLRCVEFVVDESADELTITAPFWRTDIELPEDVVEEVGRLYGYDRLPLDLPLRSLAPAERSTAFDVKRRIRDVLSRSGANDVLTYSFVHGNLLERVGQDKTQAFQVSNALSPDLQYYRLSLTPSILDLVHGNSKAGYEQFALFEINKTHSKQHSDDAGLPREFDRVALVFAAEPKTAERDYAGAAYYQARVYLMSLLAEFGLAGRVRFEPLSKHETDSAASYYEPDRSATIKVGDVVLGRIGEYKATVRSALKLSAFTAGFELGIEPLSDLATTRSYARLPRFPKVEQDISLKVPATVTYQEVFDCIWEGLADAQPEHASPSLGPVDIYQRSDDPTHKQITLRFTIASHERTLTADEVNSMLDRAAAKANQRLGAERI